MAKSAGRDVLAAALLLLAVALSWCSANAKWSAGDWMLPTAYGETQRSDVLQHLAFIKAARDGAFVPLQSKVVPELGAPLGANWNDWPIVEEWHVAGLGLLASAVGIFAALNVFLLAGHLLAAAAFYFVARSFRVSLEWAWLGALAFGLAPFLFAQSPHHPFIQWCWQVPLFLLVWRWVLSEPGVVPGSRRFWAGVSVGLIAGFQTVYFAAIFAQLVVLGALVTFARTREWRSLLAPVCFVGAAAFAFAMMNVDTWMYQWEHGANSGALLRPYRWLEIYGLGIVNWFVPAVQHHWDVFREIATRHGAERVLADEGSYFGMVGAASLLLLVGVSVVAVVRRRAQQIPMEMWQVLWIVVFFAPGGLNAIAGLFGFTYLRTGCRYSVVILAIALMFAMERLSARRWRHRPFAAVLVACCAVLLVWDQVPRVPDAAARGVIARQVESDRKFVAAMEAALPAESMLFQIPVMEYPESESQGLGPSDHFRPYLYSERLRFSFGTNKGREDSKWLSDVQQVSLEELISEVQARGFEALYINRRGFPDNGVALLNVLESMGYGRVIESDEGDLVCVRLR